MNGNPNLGFDLWHLLGLIAQRKEANDKRDLWSEERELFAGHPPRADLAESILNRRTLSRRYQESMELHAVAR